MSDVLATTLDRVATLRAKDAFGRVGFDRGGVLFLTNVGYLLSAGGALLGRVHAGALRPSRHQKGAVKKRKRILICDDDAATLDLLQVILELEGYEVVRATNGEKALEIVGDENPDLIILNILMPALNGFETAERLKDNQATRDIPVMFLSTMATWPKNVIQRGEHLGVEAAMAKPFDPDVLLNVIERLLLFGTRGPRGH